MVETVGVPAPVFCLRGPLPCPALVVLSGHVRQTTTTAREIVCSTCGLGAVSTAYSEGKAPFALVLQPRGAFDLLQVIVGWASAPLKCPGEPIPTETCHLPGFGGVWEGEAAKVRSDEARTFLKWWFGYMMVTAKWLPDGSSEERLLIEKAPDDSCPLAKE